MDTIIRMWLCAHVVYMYINSWSSIRFVFCLQIYDHILENHTFGTCKICGNTQLKISAIFFLINFFACSDKGTITPSYCEISQP